ncbi:SRPBCC family protein [Taibaiella koreensis]|uniref:hypothetical protein n=1 Tax=Taibaiella koreensis TaxID=1268548 RepID=UPI000E5A0DDF|nr:hypothetical protein [Taibaiella koreensis]
MDKERAIITDKLVKAQTGKTMEEWFLKLDKLGAKAMKHAEIFSLVGATKGLEPLGQWNQNLLTTSYEWSRGLKQRGEKENGFEISVSKTMNVPVQLLYQSWTDSKLSARWLPGETFTIRKATENKSLRITWSDDTTSVSVELYIKTPEKTQIVVQHMKLPDAEQAAARKEYWSGRLEALKALIA